MIDGNNMLRNRPFAPLFSTLRAKDAEFGFYNGVDSLPCIALSSKLPGGRYQLETDVSSQFATALMVAAPLADALTTIKLIGKLYSSSYIRQTAAMMRHFGVDGSISADEREILIPNGQSYRSRGVDISGDYTSASYLMGAAFVSRGKITLLNLEPYSLQGEREIIDIIAALGGKVEWLQTSNELKIDCTDLPKKIDVAFDLSDSPNILPTVTAMAVAIPGRVRLTGGRLTQFHKSRRIEAMATELAKAGVGISVLRGSKGAADGLDIRSAR